MKRDDKSEKQMNYLKRGYFENGRAPKYQKKSSNKMFKIPRNIKNTAERKGKFNKNH